MADKDFIYAALDLHNKYRTLHGAPALEIDETLNREAQDYADYQSKRHIQKHSSEELDKYGENLAYKGSTQVPSGTEAAEWAVFKWYEENQLYNFVNPDLDEKHKWGHFTALAWKGTKKMGIGATWGTKLSATGNPMETLHVVARYLPPPNTWTQEALLENVLPRKG